MRDAQIENVIQQFSRGTPAVFAQSVEALNDPMTLSTLTTLGKDNQTTLLSAALHYVTKDAQENEKKRILVDALGTHMSAVRLNNDSLITAVEQGNVPMVTYLFPYYLQSPSALKAFWGTEKAARIQSCIEKAISNIDKNSLNAKCILKYIKGEVMSNPDGELSSSMLGVMSSLQLLVNKKMNELFPEDQDLLRESTSGLSPVLPQYRSLARLPSSNSFPQSPLFNTQGDFFMKKPEDLKLDSSGATGNPPPTENILTVTTAKFIAAMRENNVALVKEMLKANPPNITTQGFLDAISQVGAAHEASIPVMKKSIEVLDEVVKVSTIMDQRIPEQTKTYRAHVTAKMAEIKTNVKNVIIKAIEDGIQSGDWTAPLAELHAFMFQYTKVGNDSYQITMEHYNKQLAALGLNPDGTLLSPPVTGADKGKMKVGFNLAGDTPEVKFDDAKKFLAEVFINPASTLDAFTEAYDSMTEAEAVLFIKQKVEKEDASDKHIENLLSIQVEGLSLFEYACIKGLLVLEGAVQNPNGVNPEIWAALVSYLNTEDLKKAFARVAEDGSAIHPTMKAFVRSYTGLNKSIESGEGGSGSGASAAPEALLSPLNLQSVTNLDDITVRIAQYLDRSEIVEFLAHVALLRAYTDQRAEDKSTVDANFIAALRSITVNAVVGEVKPTLLQHAIRKPDGAAFVHELVSKLGAEITDGVVDSDPLVIASREGRPEMVALLLPYYLQDDKYWGDKYSQIKQCIEMAIVNVGVYSGHTLDDVSKSLDVLARFKAVEAFASQYAEQLAATETRLKELKIKILEDVIVLDFKDTSTSLEKLSLDLKNLKACYAADNDFHDALRKLNLLEHAAANGLSNAVIFKSVLNTLLSAGQYNTPEARQALYDAAGKNPQVQALLLRGFGQHRLVPVTAPGAMRETGKTLTGLTLSLEQIKANIANIFKDGTATKDEFDAAVQDLFAYSKGELAKVPVAFTYPDIVEKTSELLLTIEAEKDKKLLAYVCEKGLYNGTDVSAVNPAVYLSFLAHCQSEQVKTQLAAIADDDRHASVKPYLTPYAATPTKSFAKEPTRWDNAKTGAKWGAGMACLAIVGILIDAYFFGDSKMHERICSVADWCWKDALGQGAGHNVSAVHEREMASCVGAATVLVSAGLGYAAGAAVPPKKSAGPASVAL